MNHSCKVEAFKILQPDLQNLLLEFQSLSWLLNGNADTTARLPGSTFHDVLLQLGYRLVEICPLNGPRPASPIENALHIGLVAYIMHFLRGVDRRIPNLPVLAKLARSSAQEYFARSKNEEEVTFWLLFIGAGSVFENSDDAWLLPRLLMVAEPLGLLTWDDARSVLSKFPWVNVLHDRTGQELWHKSHPQ